MSGIKMLAGTINGAVAMMAVSFLIWSVLLADYFSAQMPGVEALDPQNLLFQILAASVHALLVTIFLHRKEASSLGACMKDAALLGALMWLGVNLWNMGSYGMWTMQGAMADALLSSIPFGAGGGAIFWTTMRGELQSGRAGESDTGDSA